MAQQTSVVLKREVERLIASLDHARSDVAIPEASNPRTERTGTPGTPGTLGTPGTPALDSFKYLGFEDAFRGSTDAIRSRLQQYVPAFAGQTAVLDLGCGRGEFLDLLREAGIEARGLDLNHEMVEACRARGHDVAEGDALAYLQSLPDASLGGVFAAQVVEHLEPDYLGRLIETARLKLRAGGVLVLETINASCWLAFFESYIRDLTHVRPLHPDTLQFLVRASGFHDVRIEFKSPVDRSARLATAVAPGVEDGWREALDTINENMAKLNERLFSYQDFAVLARA
jgi:O-antigen chain-terminating methyltransferase